MGDAPMSEHKCGIPVAVLIATELQGGPTCCFKPDNVPVYGPLPIHGVRQ